MMIPTSDPAEFQGRVLSLGREALEGSRELSEVLGEAFCELRAAVSAIESLQGELREKDRLLSRLRAELDEARVPVPAPSAALPGRARRRAGALPEAAEERLEPPLDLLRGSVPDRTGSLEAFLRERIAAALYLGTLRGGERLPSIRELARRSGLNHKVVRRVYRVLAREGLVEVRDRSGIYTSAGEARLAGEMEETDAWIARTLVEAAERGIRAGELPSILGRRGVARPLRCACVDAAEDDRLALCREIAAWFGLTTVPVAPRAGGRLPEMEDADLVVTTPFHAGEVRGVLAPRQPLVVAGLHPRLRDRIRQALRAGACTIVCVDPASGHRLLRGLDGGAARARVAAAEAVEAGEVDLRGGVIATLAARERLGGALPPDAVAAPPFLDRRTAREVAALVVHLSRAASAP